MPLFYVDKDNIYNDSLYIKGDTARHISRSLRMAVGDSITVSDGEGARYSCRLSSIHDDECIAKILEKTASSSESPVDITLFMAYPKSDKLELVIQKAAELGACRIIPFESSRCIKRPSEDKAERRLARLNKIAKEAAAQCGRDVIPRVLDTLKFPAMLKSAGECDLTLFCYEGTGAVSMREALEKSGSPKTIGVVVGCEGGFSPEEAAAAAEAGLVITNLGPRILRCETAPMYALSALSYFFEL